MDFFMSQNYLISDHSEDHILDALLKTKLINKHSKKVCVPLLRKILSELVVRRPLAELTYVRFLLSFKLWKNVVEDVEERRAINKLAAQRLHPPPEYFLVQYTSTFVVILFQTVVFTITILFSLC